MKIQDYIDIAKINALFSPAGMRRVNEFLEALPQRLGLNILIIAAIVWGGAAVLVFYTSIQAKSLSELRSQLSKADALQPSVPKLESVPVANEELEKYIKAVQPTLQGIRLTVENGALKLVADNTSLYNKFREAVLQSFNAGQNWRLTLKTLCVGRECLDKGGALQGAFAVTRYTVTPAPQQ